MKPISFVLMVIFAIVFLPVCGSCATDTTIVDTAESSIELPIEQSRHVEALADRLLKEMGDYLKSAKAFTFQAESSYDDIDRNGQKIRYGGVADVSVLRPNRLRSFFNGDERKTRTFYDGKRFTIYNAAVNMYAVTDVPPDIDGAIDMIADKYGVTVPLVDIVYADPYNILIENVMEGRWVGLHSIAGVPCDHLAFIQETIDWEIWIEHGPRPVPLQVLITYKDEPGWPQYMARMRSWDFKPNFSNDYFKFQPPVGSDEIEFLVVPEMEVNDDSEK